MVVFLIFKEVHLSDSVEHSRHKVWILSKRFWLWPLRWRLLFFNDMSWPPKITTSFWAVKLVLISCRLVALDFFKIEAFPRRLVREPRITGHGSYLSYCLASWRKEIGWFKRSLLLLPYELILFSSIGKGRLLSLVFLFKPCDQGSTWDQWLLRTIVIELNVILRIFFISQWLW